MGLFAESARQSAASLLWLKLFNAELSGRGAGGDRDPRRLGKRETYLTPHCHHHNDFPIKMGSGVILMFR